MQFYFVSEYYAKIGPIVDRQRQQLLNKINNMIKK